MVALSRARPSGARLLMVALLLVIVGKTTIARAATPGPPNQRLFEQQQEDAGATTTAPASARARDGASPLQHLPPSHAHHENALEAVRFDLAIASLRRQANALGDAVLEVNATRDGNALLLHATPATRAAEPLHVSWRGLADARPDDMITVLLLGDEDENVTSAAPAKYLLLGSRAAAAAHSAAAAALPSSGAAELRLANYLSPRVALALLRGGVDAPTTLLAPLVVLRNAAHARAPLQRRLSLAPPSSDGTTALAVRWTTRTAGGRPAVWWTDEPPARGDGELNRHFRRYYKHYQPASPPPLTYTRQEMCGGDAQGVGFSSPGFFHTAVMDGLVPGRRYWYVVGDASGDADDDDDNNNSSNREQDERSPPSPPPPPRAELASPETSFLAPPAPGARAERVRVLVTADMGQAEPDGWSQTPSYTNEASVRTARALAAEVEAAAAASSSSPPPASLVLHAGDISYARGFAALWSAFHDLVEPVASTVPYMVAAGNHERDWPSSGDRFSAETGEAGTRSQPPEPAGGQEARRWRDARGDAPARDTYDSGGECGVAYSRRFAMPRPEDAPFSRNASSSASAAAAAAGDRPWYAFDHGPLRFVVLSTEHNFMPGSEQHSFVERALEATAEQRRRHEEDARKRSSSAEAPANGDSSASPPPLPPAWLVLVGHRPIHICSSWDGYADADGAVSRALRRSLEPLMARHPGVVDLTISGHHHSYGRTCPVVPTHWEEEEEEEEDDPLAGPECAPEEEGGRGVVHLVAGHGGAPLSLNPSFPPSPIWRRLRYDWGYLRLDADAGAGRLRVEAVGHGGEVVDAFELLAAK